MVLNVAFGDQTTEEDEQTSVVMLPLAKVAPTVAREGWIKRGGTISSPRSKIHNLFGS
jgi:hypothetical protein